MIEFDLESFLEEIKDLPFAEKLERLDDLCDELYNAAEEVVYYKRELEDEHNKSVKEAITDQIRSFIVEEHLENCVTITNDRFLVKTGQVQAAISLFCSVADPTELHINTLEFIINNEKRYDTLSSLAQLSGFPYKRGDEEIVICVEGSPLPVLKSIITKLCTC